MFSLHVYLIAPLVHFSSILLPVHHKVFLIDEILKDQTLNAKYVVTFSNTTSQLYIYSFSISAYPVAGAVLRPSCTPLGWPMPCRTWTKDLGICELPSSACSLSPSLHQGCPEIQKICHCLAFSKSRKVEMGGGGGDVSLLETFL